MQNDPVNTQLLSYLYFIRDIFSVINLFIWFHLFFCEKEIWKLQDTQLEQVKNDLFERGV